MGTRCAPNYAIIFMSELEEEFLQQEEKKPAIWKRFINDIFLVWTYSTHRFGKLHGETEQFPSHHQIYQRNK